MAREGSFPRGSHMGRANMRLVCNVGAGRRYSVCVCKGGVAVYLETTSGIPCLEVVSHICGNYLETCVCDCVKMTKMPDNLWFIFFFSKVFFHVLHESQLQPMISCRVTLFTKE